MLASTRPDPEVAHIIPLAPLLRILPDQPVAQLVGALSHAPKRCWLTYQSGHIPKCGFNPQSGHV